MTTAALVASAYRGHDAAANGVTLSRRIRVLLGMFLVAGLVFVNDAVFRRTYVEQFTFDWQIAMRLGLCGCCGLYGWVHRQHAAQWRKFPAALALAFILWTLFTVPFAVSRNYAIASSVALICLALFVPAALAELGGRRLVLSIFAGLFVYAAGSWFAHFYFPTLSFQESEFLSEAEQARMAGLNSSNGTGRQAAALWALTIAIAVARTAPKRLLFVSGAMALVTLWATDSRTAILAALSATSVVIAERVGRRNTIILASMVGMLAAGGIFLLSNGPAGFSADSVLAKFSRSGEAEEIYHLTGRVELWDFAIACIQQSPFFGYGWGCTRFLLIDGHFATHHAHNLILNVTLGGGILAGALVAATLISLIGRGLHEPNLWPDVVTALICVGGMADVVMLNPVPDSHTLMWMTALHWRSMGASLRTDNVLDANLGEMATAPADIVDATPDASGTVAAPLTAEDA